MKPESPGCDTKDLDSFQSGFRPCRGMHLCWTSTLLSQYNWQWHPSVSSLGTGWDWVTRVLLVPVGQRWCCGTVLPPLAPDMEGAVGTNSSPHAVQHLHETTGWDSQKVGAVKPSLCGWHAAPPDLTFASQKGSGRIWPVSGGGDEGKLFCVLIRTKTKVLLVEPESALGSGNQWCWNGLHFLGRPGVALGRSAQWRQWPGVHFTSFGWFLEKQNLTTIMYTPGMSKLNCCNSLSVGLPSEIAQILKIIGKHSSVYAEGSRQIPTLYALFGGVALAPHSVKVLALTSKVLLGFGTSCLSVVLSRGVTCLCSTSRWGMASGPEEEGLKGGGELLYLG